MDAMNSIENQKFDPSLQFGAMAKRIVHNAGQSFGGAFVIVPPNGDPIETLILDAKQDPAQFWSLIKTRCDIALQEIDERQRTTRPFGR